MALLMAADQRQCEFTFLRRRRSSSPAAAAIITMKAEQPVCVVIAIHSFRFFDYARRLSSSSCL